MGKQLFISLLIVIFFNFALGCTVVKPQKISPQKFSFDENNIEGIVLLNSTEIKFDNNGGKYVAQDSLITGISVDSAAVSVKCDSILYLNVKKYDIAGTVVINCIIAAVLSGLIYVLIEAPWDKNVDVAD